MLHIYIYYTSTNIATIQIPATLQLVASFGQSYFLVAGYLTAGRFLC